MVDHVARERRLLPAVYLARGGRLRCAALRGYWQARDGLPGRAGIMGRTLPHGDRGRSSPTSAPARTTSRPTRASWPRRASRCIAGGLTVGRAQRRVARAAAATPTSSTCASARARSARASSELGGLPAESATQRLLRHVADIAALQDADAVADGLLNAALDLVPLGSALLARTTGRDGRLRPSCAAGPLAPVLRAAAARVDRRLGRSDGISCFTVGEPEPPPAAANLAELRAAGVETMVAVGLFVQGELLGALVLASAEPAVISTDDVELLEQLATHGAALPAHRRAAGARCASAPRPTR